MKNRIKALRKAKGYRQEDLAAALGVSRQTIIAIENDRYDPTLGLAMPLAAFATALVRGMRRGFSPLLPAAAFLLFLPTVPLHYNVSAWGCAVVYAVVVLAGNGVGRLFYGGR